MLLEQIRNQYMHQNAWIVGKGPSLEHLRKEHFGEGVILCLNQSIEKVQELGLANPVFSLQRDGCGIDKPHAVCVAQPERLRMVRPKGNVTLVVQAEGYSEYCMQDYPSRLVIDPTFFGLAATEMSIRVVMAMARWMGCFSFTLVCCDSIAVGDMRTFDVAAKKVLPELWYSSMYKSVARLVVQDLKNVPHNFIIPGVNHVQ